MSLPDVASREEWLEARRRLLAQEKEFTRGRDALNASRRRLPMSGSTRSTCSRARTERSRWPACSAAAGS